MADYVPNWEQLQKAEFFAELAYKTPQERQSILESSPYADNYFLDEDLQTDEFAAVLSYEGAEAFHIYRGSSNQADIITDGYLAIGKLLDTDRFKSSKTLSDQIKSKYGDGFDITHVGHSLGGTLADQIARQGGDKSISFNQGSTPIHNYGSANQTHQQVRIDNDFVSSFTHGNQIVVGHTPNPVERHLQRMGQFGRFGQLANASKIVSSVMSHYTSNFRKMWR